jgi:coenzyme F420-reducing hydrogenase delta subunit
MQDSPWITVFVCANCARPARRSGSALKERPVVPDFKWPVRTQQIIVPCTGRLQPEHVLKAFESGASVVSVIACQESNCQYIEGSRRCSLRVDFVRSILEEIGLGGGRLLLFSLPGSAHQDLELSAGKTESANHSESLETQIAVIRDQVTEAFRSHPPNPLQQLSRGDSGEDGSLETATFK